jgi:thermolysin
MSAAKFRIRYQTAFLAVVITLTLASVGYGQLPQSPVDPTVNTSDVVATTDAQKAAAVNTMFGWVESTLGPQLGMDNPKQEWTAKAVEKDTSGRWNFTLNQAFQGITVKDGHLSIIVQEGAVGVEPDWHGAYMDDPQVDINPKISGKQAISIVQKMVKSQIQNTGKGGGNKGQEENGKKPDRVDQVNGGSGKASLEVHPGGGPGKRLLTYHVTFTDNSGIEPIQMEAWVNQDGEIVESYNNAQTYDLNGQGRTLYQGTQGSGYGVNYFKVDYNGSYVLNDENLRIGTYQQIGGTIYQCASSSPIFGNYSLSDRNTTSGDVYFGTVQTYSFMYYILGRNWVNGAGGPRKYGAVDGLGTLITAINHVGVNYNNAYWDGEKINIGDGDGFSFRSLSSLDVVGHEWFHGVTQFNGRGGLNYVGESGAANESFSDIFGCMVENYWYGQPGGIFGTTWQVGEGCYTPGTGGDALRYMYRPTIGGGGTDHYSLRYTGSSDNGGVHFNSGIQNNAFWLLATGGSHRLTGAMSGGIGTDAATRIFYKYLTAYALPTDGFHYVRVYTQYAAGVLYGFGSVQYNRTVEAWNKVGVP